MEVQTFLVKTQIKAPQQLSSSVLPEPSLHRSRFPMVSQHLLQAFTCSSSQGGYLRPAQCRASVKKLDSMAQMLEYLCCVLALPQALRWSYMALEFSISEAKLYK